MSNAMVDRGAIEAMTGTPVMALQPLRGGDVASSYRVEPVEGPSVFAKTHAAPPPGFFSTEAWGLAWLADGLAGHEDGWALSIPRVIGHSDDPPLLVLAWIDEGGETPPHNGPDESAVGRALAALHRSGAPCFGRRDRRTTGSRRLPNDPTDSWVEFYAERRLHYLARLGADQNALSPSTVTAIDDVANRLADLGGPPEPPARLHGDLWAGNRLVDRTGHSWLIDPAAHGGHREYDLAMMRLFGGFGPAVFSAYHEHFALADGWEDRVRLHQLAPLIVHAIKFGGGYHRATDEALSSYR
jgi:fructosamine-3-kinase